MALVPEVKFKNPDKSKLNPVRVAGMLEPFQTVYMDLGDSKAITFCRSYLAKSTTEIERVVVSEEKRKQIGESKAVRITRYSDTEWRLTFREDVKGGCPNIVWGVGK